MVEWQSNNTLIFHKSKIYNPVKEGNLKLTLTSNLISKKKVFKHLKNINKWQEKRIIFENLCLKILDKEDSVGVCIPYTNIKSMETLDAAKLPVSALRLITCKRMCIFAFDNFHTRQEWVISIYWKKIINSFYAQINHLKTVNEMTIFAKNVIDSSKKLPLQDAVKKFQILEGIMQYLKINFNKLKTKDYEELIPLTYYLLPKGKPPVILIQLYDNYLKFRGQKKDCLDIIENITIYVVLFDTVGEYGLFIVRHLIHLYQQGSKQVKAFLCKLRASTVSGYVTIAEHIVTCCFKYINCLVYQPAAVNPTMKPLSESKITVSSAKETLEASCNAIFRFLSAMCAWRDWKNIISFKISKLPKWYYDRKFLRYTTPILIQLVEDNFFGETWISYWRCWLNIFGPINQPPYVFKNAEDEKISLSILDNLNLQSSKFYLTELKYCYFPVLISHIHINKKPIQETLGAFLQCDILDENHKIDAINALLCTSSGKKVLDKLKSRGTLLKCSILRDMKLSLSGPFSYRLAEQSTDEDLETFFKENTADNLLALNASSTLITNNSAKRISSFERLFCLILSFSLFTDRGIGILSQSNLKLKQLYLCGCKISDKAAFDSLSKMKTLELLVLYDTEITDKGYRCLAKSLPHTDIYINHRKIPPKSVSFVFHC